MGPGLGPVLGGEFGVVGIEPALPADLVVFPAQEVPAALAAVLVGWRGGL